MADEKANPPSAATAVSEPAREQPVEPYIAGKPPGERQDGAGAAPPRADRHDALPAGETARRRTAGTAQGEPEEPGAGHRGKPAGMTTGAATGSGSGAGGGGTGAVEEPDSDSKGGGGREPGFGHARDLPGEGAGGAKHGGR